MAVQATLQLGIRNFSQNLKRARGEVRKETSAMKSDAAGVGASLTKGLNNVAGAVGASLSVAGVIQMIRQSAEEAQQLLNISAGVNESVESLARLRAATSSLGIDFEAASELTRELEDRLGDLGNSEPMEVLRRMGLEAETLMAMPIDQKVLAMADAFQKARANGVGYSDLLKLVGDSVGEQLLPLLTQTNEELERMFANVPEDISASIAQMADLNRLIGESGQSFRDGATKYFGSILGVAEFLGDVLETGSIDAAFERSGNRQVEAAREAQVQKDIADQKAAAIASARESEEAMKGEAAAAKEIADALSEVAKIKEKMAEDELKLLPPAAQVDALKEKLDGVFSGSLDNMLGNFDRSTEGLEALVAAREGMDNLPAEGENSVLEAVEWLQEARALEAEIAAIQASQAKAEADRAKAEQDRLTKLREQAEEGEFRLMDPAEQAAELRKQLSESLGIEIDGAADIEDGLKKLRDRADRAREQGDTEGEAVLLERINAAQEDAEGLAALAEQLGDGAAPAGGGEVGALGQLFNQVFGRSKEEILIDEQRRANESAERRNRTLDKILDKMDDPPEPRRFGFDE